MNFLTKVHRTPEGGFTCVRGLMFAAAISLLVIPLVFSGLTMAFALMTALALSVLVIPVLYIHSGQ